MTFGSRKHVIIGGVSNRSSGTSSSIWVGSTRSILKCKYSFFQYFTSKLEESVPGILYANISRSKFNRSKQLNTTIDDSFPFIDTNNIVLYCRFNIELSRSRMTVCDKHNLGVEFASRTKFQLAQNMAAKSEGFMNLTIRRTLKQSPTSIKTGGTKKNIKLVTFKGIIPLFFLFVVPKLNTHEIKMN